MTTQDQQPSADVEVRPYFATPMAVLRLPDAGPLNARLAQTVRERMVATGSTDHSNRGGWQSEWDFATWGGREGAALLSTARQLADHLTCDRTGRPAKVQWVVNAWANVNGPDHGNEFHTHSGSYWSGAYYVDDGGAGADPALGGEFELQDPRGVAPAMYAPQLAVNVPGGLSIGASELIRPEAGTMLMFPAWLSHCVRPYRGSGERISIAFNFSLAQGG